MNFEKLELGFSWFMALNPCSSTVSWVSTLAVIPRRGSCFFYPCSCFLYFVVALKFILALVCCLSCLS